jgi:hypothetical protein
VINNNTTINKVSYNGGPGGAPAQPNAAEQNAARERHIAPTSMQTQHQQSAGSNRALLASANHGQPPIAASPKAGVFSGPNVVAASKTNAALSKANTGPAGNNAGGKDGFKPFSANAVKSPNGGNGNGGSKNSVTPADGRFNGNSNTVANTNNTYKPGNGNANANGRFNGNGNGYGNNTYKPVNNTAKQNQNYSQANAGGPPQPRGGHPPSNPHHNPPPQHNNRQGKEQR